MIFIESPRSTSVLLCRDNDLSQSLRRLEERGKNTRTLAGSHVAVSGPIRPH